MAELDTDAESEQIINDDIKLHGRSYWYKTDYGYQRLSPYRVKIYRDNTPITTGIPRYTEKPAGMFKRFVKRLTNPTSLIVFLPVAYFVVFFTNHHSVTAGKYWFTYLIGWAGGTLVYALMREAHIWAGGKAPADD